ncbi:hypothetical protein GA0074696_4106 [Micromonospora purpureochromogenes]|uniref:Uncharacterized protein n=1 Tax=Micromonospora purpureochromogenes TaxID=47872 RepID=A0A1C4Z773_9ACTN|nr:hypothetical protein [Micromonospora purpureochromogenes]SCF28747.1 hypothetical protein GA0074696_4106 [Micromonospora purpureochromogenes]
MRVELAPEIFTAADPEPHHIAAASKLLAAFDERRHDWIVDIEIVDNIAEYLHKHHPTLAEIYFDLAQKASVKSLAWTGTAQRGGVLFVEREQLPEHASDLTRAAVVVIENIPGDKSFLQTVIHAFRAHRIQQALESRWAEFRHSGGSGSMPAVAEEEAGHFHHTVRVVAIFDSDSLTPDHEGPNRPKASDLIEKGIPAHVLLLREAENYAPNLVLANIGKRGEAELRVQHLERLVPRQRAHFDMKKGFTRPEKAEQKGFFDDLDADTRRVLHPGFGGKVLEQMFEMRHDLCAADFEAMDPDAAEDLRKLLALIESLI